MCTEEQVTDWEALGLQGNLGHDLLFDDISALADITSF